MNMENWSQLDTVPLHRGGSPLTSYVTMLQIGQHSGDLVRGTVLAQVGSSRKWMPITPGNTDGSQLPRAVLMRTISEADIQAGDVENVPIARGGSEPVIYDESRLIIEGPGTFDTVVNNPTNLNSTIRELLVWANIYVIATLDIEAFTPVPGP